MRKEFDWDEFINEDSKIAVHCRTLEEAKDFCQKKYEHGVKWCNNEFYLSTISYEKYETETCYIGLRKFCDYDFCIGKGYTILEWSDYMQKEFTKADLKDWMVIEQRDKERYVIMGEKLLNAIGFNHMDGIEDDLTDREFKTKDFDIIKVYKLNTKKIYKLGDIFKDENLELIWERNETKHMTAEEMRVKLEEMTGDKIEPSIEEKFCILYNHCHKTDCNNCCFDKGFGVCEFRNDLGDKDNIEQCYKKVIKDEKTKSKK